MHILMQGEKQRIFMIRHLQEMKKSQLHIVQNIVNMFFINIH